MLTINDIVSYHIDNPDVKLAVYTDKISDLDILSKTNSTIIKASSIYEKNSIKHINILDISYNDDIELTISKKAKLLSDIINFCIRPSTLLKSQEQIIEGVLKQLYGICKSYLDRNNKEKAYEISPTLKDVESRLSVYKVGTDGYALKDIMKQIGLFDKELCYQTNIDTNNNLICFIADEGMYENVIWQLIFMDFVYNLRLNNPKYDIISKTFINGKTK